MQIDGNEPAIRQNDLDRKGRHEEALAIKKEFLKQVRESGDHCPAGKPAPTTASALNVSPSAGATGTTCPCACGTW